MNYFPDMIGQETVKETLGIFIDASRRGKVVPNLLAIAPKGVGKTMFCRGFADKLDKDIIEVNGGDMKTPKQVAEGLFAEIQGQKVTVFVDEAHGISRAVETMLLTVLNTERNHKTSIVINGTRYEFDFRDLTVIFATTEIQEVFKPLRDRFRELHFDEYTPFELSYILAQNIGDTSISDEALDALADYSRGNPRWATKTGNEINNYCTAKDIDIFTPAHIADFTRIMGIYPLGLSKQEILLLKLLKEYPKGATLTALANRMGNTIASQKDIEIYLTKKNLLEIDGTRRITNKGLDLLKTL